MLLMFEIEQLEIREEAWERIELGVPETELAVFKIVRGAPVDPAMQWYDRHEFRYHGEMYDVVRVAQQADTTLLYCLADEKESELLAKRDVFEKQQAQPSHRPRKQQRNLQRFLSTFYSVINATPRLHFVTETAQSHLYLFRLKTWTSAPSTPPPKA